ncbi:MAG: hypothetical protein HOW73_43175 [Polyangiaceae bacterium]|nr:hypothetical protein [Polyangiaceae bacterium]
MEMYVRIKPTSLRREQHMMSLGQAFLREKGWYGPIDSSIAEQLRFVRVHDTDPNSAFVFDVCTKAEAEALTNAERVKVDPAGTVESPKPVFIAPPAAAPVPAAAATDRAAIELSMRELDLRGRELQLRLREAELEKQALTLRVRELELKTSSPAIVTSEVKVDGNVVGALIASTEPAKDESAPAEKEAEPTKEDADKPASEAAKAAEDVPPPAAPPTRGGRNRG